jgi:uncharacterized protein YkwD
MVVAAKSMLGTVLLGAGIGVAALGVGVSVARRGAGLGLSFTAFGVCASGLFVAVYSPGPAVPNPPAVAAADTPRAPASSPASTPAAKPPPPEAESKTQPATAPRKEKRRREEIEEDPKAEEPKKDKQEREKEEARDNAPARPEPPRPEDGPIIPQGEAIAAKALERINFHRAVAGQPAVVLRDTLSKGCLLHADYLAFNYHHPTFAAEGPHRENRDLPGYTAQGEETARNSVINFITAPNEPPGLDPREQIAVDSLMSTFFHRVPLLHPDLRHVGIGTARGRQKGQWHWVTVVDIRDSRRSGGSRGWVVLYPGDGQKDVPTTFLNTEHPSPTPPEGFGKKLGYCVTATFAAATKVAGAEARLTGPDGEALDAWVSSPSRPAAGAQVQMNTVCIIAKTPLRPMTTYTATVNASVDGKDQRRSWSFTTGAE